MDFANILKLFSPNQREILICFLVLLPCYFTLLFLYIPSFAEYELLYQVILSTAGTIIMIFVSNVFISLSNFAARTNVYNPVTIIINNLAIIANILKEDNYVFNKQSFIDSVVLINGIVGIGLVIVFVVHRVLKKCEDEGN
jgi:hypothetical protein